VKRLNLKLYVGNLDYSVTGDQLKELFAQAGSVTDAVVISDRYSGRSKGFGFVEMSNEEGVKKAIEMFNGQDFQGRKLIVNEARPKQPRESQRPQ
jgi:cold-inducible RNA-binding protein